MNRKNAKEIANIITNEQLMQMFINAKNNIVNWTEISKINKGCTVGTAWNILAKDFDINVNYHILTKINMIREFGNYLPTIFKVTKNKKIKNIRIVHQEPNFDKFI
jgi:hypothetical protein